MTPKQRRSYNRAAKAVADLGRETLSDGEAYNTAMIMVARSLGAMLGSAAGLRNLPVDDLRDGLRLAHGEVERAAAEAYGEALAFQNGEAGPVQ